MANRSKTLFVGLTAAFLLASAVGTASARRLEVSNQRFLAIWENLVLNEARGGTPIECPVTLEGSFHSKTISKVSGQLVGYVSNAVVNEAACRNERARVLRETLPWHIQYNSFAGALPSITSIRTALVNASFLVRAFGFISCLYRTSQAEPSFGIINRETVTGVAGSLSAEAGTTIASQTGGCPRGSFSGTAELFVQGSTTTRITVRLVQ